MLKTEARARGQGSGVRSQILTAGWFTQLARLRKEHKGSPHARQTLFYRVTFPARDQLLKWTEPGWQSVQGLRARLGSLPLQQVCLAVLSVTTATSQGVHPLQGSRAEEAPDLAPGNFLGNVNFLGFVTLCALVETPKQIQGGRCVTMKQEAIQDARASG